MLEQMEICVANLLKSSFHGDEIDRFSLLKGVQTPNSTDDSLVWERVFHTSLLI